MKSRIIRHITRATLIAAAVLAVCISAATANAQSAGTFTFEGKFTLPYEAHWGQAALPAGDYLLSVTEVPATMIIRDAKSGRTVARIPPRIEERSARGENALLIGTRGTQRVVHSFSAAELGVVFISDPTLASEQGRGEEARQTQSVPVLVAKK